VFAIALALFAHAQQRTVPLTLKKTFPKISNEDGLTLGAGVSLDTIAPAYESPFREIKASRELNADPVGHVHTHLVTTTKAMDAVNGTNLEAKAHFLFVSAESKVESERTSSISEDSFRLVIIGDSQYGHTELREPKLRPEAASLIEKGKMTEFSQRYGTHFVLREHRIAKILLTISVDRWSQNTLQKLRAALAGGASIPLIGGELKTSIQNDLKEAASRNALSVDVSTVGGTGLQGFGDIVKALVSNSPDFQASIGEALSGLLKGFTQENSGIGAVTVVSYLGYGWDPSKLNLWNDLFEDKLQQCADRYYAGRQIQRNIRTTIPNVEPPLKQKLEEHAVKYDAYLAQLADFQKGLLIDKNETLIKSEFPKEPKIDPESEKALFARFSTLDNRITALSDDLSAVKGDRFYFTRLEIPAGGWAQDRTQDGWRCGGAPPNTFYHQLAEAKEILGVWAAWHGWHNHVRGLTVDVGGPNAPPNLVSVFVDDWNANLEINKVKGSLPRPIWVNVIYRK
jgi:hypothetical protein